MTDIFKYVVSTSLCCLLLSCSGQKADTNSSDYYYEDDSVVIEEVEVIDIDDIDNFFADSCDYSQYEEVAVEEADVDEPVIEHNQSVKTQVDTDLPKQTTQTQNNHLQSQKEKLEKRTEVLYEIWQGKFDDYNVIGIFYNQEDNKVTTLIMLEDLSAASEEELEFAANTIAMIVRQTLYGDRFDGKTLDDDAALLYAVNPKFKVSMSDIYKNKKVFEYSIRETYED